MLGMQVIPTVGVGGDDGDKKNAAMLKHFRNLVDETASKARFLSSFQRVSTPSSDLDSALDPAPSVKSEDPEQTAAAADRNGLDKKPPKDSDKAPAAADGHESLMAGSNGGRIQELQGAAVKPEPDAPADAAHIPMLSAASTKKGPLSGMMGWDSKISSTIQPRDSPPSGTAVKAWVPGPSLPAVRPSPATDPGATFETGLPQPTANCQGESQAGPLNPTAAHRSSTSGTNLAKPPQISRLHADDIKAEAPLPGHGRMGTTQLDETNAAGSSRDEADGASSAPKDNESALQQLMAVVGGSADEKLAKQLLQQADGDVGRAINFLFDRPAAPAAAHAAPTAASPAAAPAAGMASSSANCYQQSCNQPTAWKLKTLLLDIASSSPCIQGMTSPVQPVQSFPLICTC